MENNQAFIYINCCCQQDFEDVIATVCYFLNKKPGSKFLCTYEERNENRSIVPLLQVWGLQTESIHTENNVHIFAISLINK